jgi:hypothetical protein
MVTAYGIPFLTMSDLFDGLLLEVLILLSFKDGLSAHGAVGNELQPTRTRPHQDQAEGDDIMTD